MHPQLAKCHVTPRRLITEDQMAAGSPPAKGKPKVAAQVNRARAQRPASAAPPPASNSHLHISALRLWVSLFSGAFGEGFRRFHARQRHTN